MPHRPSVVFALRRAAAVCLLALCLCAGPSTAAAASFADDGAWVWPLRPRPTVVRGFDPPAHDWLPGHRGVDLAGKTGQAVHSAGAGVVTYAGRLAGIGIVVVRHGDLRTTYQPVRAAVHAGSAVDAGEVIGRLESAGSHCAPAVCLHWGLLKGRTYLDPLSLVGAGPPRLLPLAEPPPAPSAAPSGARSRSTPAGEAGLPAAGRNALVLLGGAGGLAGSALVGGRYLRRRRPR
jgi:hypothetical protein